MSWPTANDYLEAVQHPLRRFCKPELKRAQVALDRAGKPRVQTGKRLDVYEFRGAGGFERWAIGCFTLEPIGLARRYHLINAHLAEHPVPALVEVEYIEQGICIRGRWYPITRSHWLRGAPLRKCVGERIDHPFELRRLADGWLRLVRELRHGNIAHGSLCADTIYVAAETEPGKLDLCLLDYDAIFVPALAGAPPEETGHPDYEHPQRLARRWYHPEMDRFAHLAIYTALQALAVGGSALFQKFDKPGNLLFTQRDFAEPATSAVFQQLWRSANGLVRDLAGHLILATQHDVRKLSALEPLVDQVHSAVGEGTSARTSLTPAQVQQIEALFAGHAPTEGQGNFDFFVDDEAPAPVEHDAFALEVDDEPEPLPLPAAAPLSAPPLMQLDMRQYTIDAWMPEQVAVLKLQGFVRETCGQIVTSEPGFIRVHLLDEQDLLRAASPGLLGWLGLVQEPPPPPRIAAIMELELAHKITDTRKLLTVTIRFAPGPGQPMPPNWNAECDRIFVKFRAYLMGTQQ